MKVFPGPFPDGRRSGGDEGLGSRPSTTWSQKRISKNNVARAIITPSWTMDFDRVAFENKLPSFSSSSELKKWKNEDDALGGDYPWVDASPCNVICEIHKKSNCTCSFQWDKTLQLEDLVRGFHCSFVLSNKASAIIEYTNSTQSSYSGLSRVFLDWAIWVADLTSVEFWIQWNNCTGPILAESELVLQEASPPPPPLPCPFRTFSSTVVPLNKSHAMLTL